jgi:predicted nucleic acid-binding protein
MSEGYFVDTNVIIDFLKKRETPSVEKLKNLLKQDVRLCINRIVLSETLRTIPIERENKFVSDKDVMLEAFQLLDIDHSIVMRSIELNRNGRSQGVSLKKEDECGWLDYIHYATAEQHQIEIISNDRDFIKISSLAEMEENA